MFNESKTAHMAAYLLRKGGGRMRYIKLLKLLYLADRESMRLTGDSMTRDLTYSLPNGPVLSQTMNLMKGQAIGEAWSAMVAKEGYESVLVADVEADDLDELSPQDIDVLNKVFADFGHVGWQKLVDWTHYNLAEWKDPHGSRIPIEPEDIFRALGWSHDEAQQMGAEYSKRRELDRLMSSFS